MIRHLTCAVPKSLLPRDHIDPRQLAQFEKVTGLKKTRRFAGTATELMMHAVRLAKPLIRMKDVGAIMVATQTPDRLSPCMAVDVAKELGSKSNCAVADVNQSCDAFLYLLWMAKRMPHDSVIVCVDLLRFNQTPLEALIFSDAASVAWVSPGEGYTHFHNQPSPQDLYCGRDGDMKMDGGKVFDYVTQNVPKLISDFELGAPSDYLCLHQPNLSMMRIIEKQTGYDGRSLHSIEEYGNCSMNSIPVTLAHNEETILGKRVMLCGFGAGMCTAITEELWSKEHITQLVEV